MNKLGINSYRPQSSNVEEREKVKRSVAEPCGRMRREASSYVRQIISRYKMAVPLATSHTTC
jgi:uncharacterized protein YdiU (UPF0061 family)